MYLIHICYTRLKIETTNSWGYKVNSKWDGIVGMLMSGEADFSISLNALRSERYDVVDYSAISTWKHLYAKLLYRLISLT